MHFQLHFTMKTSNENINSILMYKYFMSSSKVNFKKPLLSSDYLRHKFLLTYAIEIYHENACMEIVVEK